MSGPGVRPRWIFEVVPATNRAGVAVLRQNVRRAARRGAPERRRSTAPGSPSRGRPPSPSATRAAGRADVGRSTRARACRTIRGCPGRAPGGNRMKVDRRRLELTLEELSRIGETPRGGLTRLALSDDDRRARDRVVAWMRATGLAVRVDRMGNIFGERPGTEPLPPVMVGSHLDSVPTGGRYDGQLGVLCALEAIRALDDHGVRTRHPVTLVVFTNEEGARFQPAELASGVLAGRIPLEDAYNARDKDGIRLVD